MLRHHDIRPDIELMFFPRFIDRVHQIYPCPFIIQEFTISIAGEAETMRLSRCVKS